MVQKKYIEYFKEHKVDLVYRTSLLEGKIATRFQTAELLSNGKMSSLVGKDKIILLNIYASWKMILVTEADKPTIDFYSEINELLTDRTFYNPLEEGQIRVKPVTISGSSYIPPVRNYSESVLELTQLFNQVKPTTDSILYMYLVLMKQQYFNDGNKRSAYLLTNYLLMNQDLGVLYLPSDNSKKWYEYLKKWYEKGEYQPFISYLKKYFIKKV